MRVHRTKMISELYYTWLHNPSNIYRCKDCPYALSIPFRGEVFPCGNNQCTVVMNQTNIPIIVPDPDIVKKYKSESRYSKCE